MTKRSAILSLALVLLCGCGGQIMNRDSQGATIVCFGDSLTAGFGAGEGEDYPSVLRAMVDLPVINAGVNGDTTADALRRLDGDVLRHDPRIVIVTLGANDFLRRTPEEETLANMEAIIDRIQEKGAMVVWAAVKTGFFGDAYQKDFKALAARKRIVLIPDILGGILFDPRYKYDQVHPNREGYRIMAERIRRKVEPLLK
jgi:acyl-CoA thioesterase-1